MPDYEALTHCTCTECLELRCDFLGATWRTVPEETINNNAIQFNLFAQSAYRHFLPAYLLRGLGADPHAYDVCFYTVLALNLPRHPAAHNFVDDRVFAFNSTEAAAIVAFLEYVCRHDDYYDLFEHAFTALEDYWWPIQGVASAPP